MIPVVQLSVADLFRIFKFMKPLTLANIFVVAKYSDNMLVLVFKDTYIHWPDVLNRIRVYIHENYMTAVPTSWIVMSEWKSYPC